LPSAPWYKKIFRGSKAGGAVFLMATAAIGPGFLTQTALFSSDLMASFGFIILISILIDIGIQLNIWRLITVSNRRAPELVRKVLPGADYLLALLIVFGALVFNTGNIGGTAIGLNSLFGLNPLVGGLISASLALVLFAIPGSLNKMDRLLRVIGVLMLIFTLLVAIWARPDLGEALYRSVWPEKWSALKTVTLVGGTVGGYISFAGAHRLLDQGMTGEKNVQQVSRSAARAIILTGIMRFVLFLAAFGVLAAGWTLAADNPAGSVFTAAAGKYGSIFFGIVIWCAGISSVIGASYTAVSFLRPLHKSLDKHAGIATSAFILLSMLLYGLIQKPVLLLILAGTINGLILPVALALMLLAARKTALFGQYRHPLWLQLIGWALVLIMSWMGYLSLSNGWAKLLESFA